MKTEDVKSVEQFIGNPIVDRQLFVLDENGSYIRTNLLKDYINKHYLYWTLHIKAHFDTFVYDSFGSDSIRGGCVISEGDVVLDIGSNMGLFAIRASCHKPSKVICIEPIVENFVCTYSNKLPNWECMNISLSDKVMMSEMFIHTNMTHSGGASFNDFSKENLKIINKQKTISLTLDFMFEHKLIENVNFMKMDVEGAEFAILDGISDDNLSSINKVTIEIHCDITDTRIQDIQNRFIRLGYETFLHYHTNGPHHINAWKN